MTDLNTLTGSAEDVAFLAGITPQRVHQLVNEKRIEKTERGTFNLADTLQRYCEYLRGVSRGTDNTRDKTKHQNRLLKAKAEMAEMEAAKLRGDLLHASAVRAQDARLAAILRNNLQSIPDRVSAILAAESDAQAVYRTLADEIRASLEAVITAMQSENVEPAELDITRRAALAAHRASQNTPASTDEDETPITQPEDLI